MSSALKDNRRELSICAVIATRNESHYLKILLPILAQQKIDVVVIDNESTDNSHDLYSDFKDKPIIAVENLPFRGYSLPLQLEIKKSIYNKLDHDWFIHHDSDEIMEHRNRGGLRDAIEEADRNGYNALNFEEFVFLPEPDEDYLDRNYYLEMQRYYFFEPSTNRLNRAWKNGCGLENGASGGHLLSGDTLRLDPTDHILRHYIVISQDYARQKYLNRTYDRKATARGWHGNKLNFTKENLTLPDRSEFLFQLDQYDSKTFCRDMPAVKHFWQWPSNIDFKNNSFFWKHTFDKYVKYWKMYYVISKSGLFDSEYYLRNNLEVARSGVNPLRHYLKWGWQQGKNPNPYFDTEWYRRMYSLAAESEYNPLYHYICYGWKYGFNPSPRFSVVEYLEEQPELDEVKSEPLCHFLQNQES